MGLLLLLSLSCGRKASGRAPRGLGSLGTERRLSSRNRVDSKVLETVGIFESPKVQGKYETGQLFLHKVFGYRGVILFPWLARLYDRDVAFATTNGSPKNGSQSKEVKGKVHPYYQALVDSRDCPHIRAQTEAVTFLANHDDSRALYAIPGLDYVGHDDILPYTSADPTPIQHELFERFFSSSPEKVPQLVARETLQAWQEKNHPWLELSDIHRETTENLRVTAIPFYMGMREPVLSKEQPAFQYSSHVSLQAPSGHMWGTFRMEREDGYFFDCRIPPFSLESCPEDQPGYGPRK
ncbi:polymerase delta-interacting protein 2 isoform X6 [Latimeria chalumnae]|uniref:polymerase delta-interacting protein 2 isoform X6 n=1 Tax=Latimeria chalumnae TaxID=7897 RepID=UPI0006D8D8B2|nr:PREDICTED: polymerase delta-interacting protein 2-like isoform X6 [Latimeria chalumnae]|eukprot:XP_014354159.1 PREDICTED: polymerase delta-interacting protein 2-like isoform X6 [Latimeria chalumnae]